MSRRLYILIFCLGLLGNAFAQETLQYFVQHYSVSDGLSQNTVMSIIQDRDGFMWFGTWDGLNRFDGNRFRTYKPSLCGSRIASNRIDMLYEDSLGFIWMRANDGAFYRLNKHTENILTTNITDTRFGNRLPEKYLFLEPKKGTIWLSGDNQLVCVKENDKPGETDDTEQTVYTLHGEAHFILADKNGAVWAGTIAGLECVAGDEQVCYRPGENPQENYFTCGLSDGEDLWLGTTSGVIWRYTAATKHFERVAETKASVTNIARLNDKALIITTNGAGLAIYDCQNGSLEQYQSASTPLLTSDCFSDVYVDGNENAWLINEQLGVWRYDSHEHLLKHYTVTIDERYRNQLDRNFFAFEDAKGLLWLNPFGGGFSCYDEQHDCMISPLAGVSNMIHSAYIDKRGSIWLGTYDLGLDRVDAIPEMFQLSDLRQDALHTGELRALLQCQDGDVLAATKDGVIRRYDSSFDLKDTKAINGRVYCMLEKTDGEVLFGTRNNGILTSLGKHYKYNDRDKYSLLNNAVYDMLQTPDGTLWIATYGGGINILRDGKFIHQSNDWKSYPDNFGAKVRCITLVGDSMLWAATTNGLLRVNMRTLETAESPYFDIRSIYSAADGKVWLGTFGGGLVEVLNPYAEEVLDAENIRVYNSQNGLMSDIILSIVGDKTGNLWFTTEESLSHYDVSTGEIRHFKAFRQMEKASFSEAEGILLQNGDIVFGYSYGGCMFSPSKIFRSEDCPAIRFTDFLIFNKSVSIDENGPLNDNICYAPKIHLKHNESVFSIEYAAMDFAGNKDIVYAYRLDGVDDDWNYVEGETRATYTSLSAGDYTFRVRSTNAQGVWVDNEQTLTIHVQASPWLSPWAFLIYTILILLTLYQLYHNFSVNNKLRQEVEVEQKVTDIKLRFFTNISHELRTPLTLISGPVENILHHEEISPSVKTQLEIVSSNAARMLRLINQILDFRKIQNKKMKLRVQETNLAQLTQTTCNNFRKEASDKRIDFQFESTIANPMVWVDQDKTDTIIYNLLSNAFKFTPAGKSIKVRVAEKNNYALVVVSDTGVGIPKDKRGILFERFSSNNAIHTPSDKPGTGIGLNLVKELVDLHHGYIEVESEVGVGTTFTVMFCRGKDHFDADVEFIVSDTTAPQGAMTNISAENEIQRDPNLKTILVVDDNEDMRLFLSNILCSYYNVLSAADGQEAISIAEQNDLDIVISDLMMPNIDGLELTNHLKSNISTSHIPVVLLTAKSAIESQLTALQYGADDYITKPFSQEYLLARIDNILRQRERLRETFRASLMSLIPEAKDEAHELTPNEIFLNKLYDFMLKNMDNNELSVEDLVREMALGRTVFFNKLKGLTGLSPVEYIRDVRIKRAAELLLEERYNITEVTYMVGMNDSRYFAKCFKAAYGVTPTEYKKNNRK